MVPSPRQEKSQRRHRRTTVSESVYEGVLLPWYRANDSESDEKVRHSIAWTLDELLPQARAAPI